MNPIDKLKFVLAVEYDCKALKDKYRVCRTHILVCEKEGRDAADKTTSITRSGDVVFSPFDWTFDKCMNGKGCANIPFGSSPNTNTADGSFQKGRVNAAAPPVPLYPDPDNSAAERIERNKRKCTIIKDSLYKIYELDASEQKELFNAGCDPYVRDGTSYNTAYNQSLLEKNTRKILKNYLNLVEQAIKGFPCSGK